MPNSDWMANIPDGRFLPQLAIPGTHDTGAYQETRIPMTRAQTLSIPDQLQAGVRALDIRCGRVDTLQVPSSPGYAFEKPWNSGTMTEPKLMGFNVYHGPIDQGISIREVVRNVADFLEAHTNEVVLLLLKQDAGSDDISTHINSIVNTTLGAKLYPRDAMVRRWPSLGECRGKALVLSRLKKPGNSHYSTRGWPDNRADSQVWCKRDFYGVKIQDLYDKPEIADKKRAVLDAIVRARGAARTNNQTVLHLNFTSFVWAPWEPVWSGPTHMTPYLRRLNSGAGVICVDGITEELATHIIDWNMNM